MSEAAWEQLLRESIEDRWVSRSERRGLRDELERAALTPQQRRLLRGKAFALAKDVAGDKAATALVDWLEDVVNLLAHVADEQVEETLAAAAFSPGRGPREAILQQLEDARASVDICVFTITDDVLSRALCRTHRRGVPIRVISDNSKSEDMGSDIERFRDAGIEVRIDHTDNHMHHKFALFDDRTLLTGSYNWTRSAAAHNEENVVLCDDPRLLRAFRGEFDRLWVHFSA